MFATRRAEYQPEESRLLDGEVEPPGPGLVLGQADRTQRGDGVHDARHAGKLGRVLVALDHVTGGRLALVLGEGRGRRSRLPGPGHDNVE
ncbi:hypothetical protein SAZ11_38850 [Streptomyces sp. FXJ1.4098]|nr:hypothetical protein [Streptomyces sp. FXJ1.4098]